MPILDEAQDALIDFIWDLPNPAGKIKRIYVGGKSY